MTNASVGAAGADSSPPIEEMSMACPPRLCVIVRAAGYRPKQAPAALGPALEVDDPAQGGAGQLELLALRLTCR